MEKNKIKFILLGIYCFILVSPSLFYYLAQGVFTVYLPIFVLLQILLIASPLFIFNLNPKIYLWLTLPFFIFSILHWGNFSIFKFELAEGGMLAIWVTNSNEGLEFLPLLPFWFWLGLVGSVSIFFYLLFQKWIKFNFTFKRRIIFSIILIGCLTPKMMKSVKDLKETFELSYPSRNLLLLLRTQGLYQEYLKDLVTQKPAQYEVAVSPTAPAPIHILIIGESARKHSWQLYGYSRETNPFLKKKEGQLLIFKDAYSASNSTVMSLRWILSQKRTDGIITVPQIFKKAGLSSVWISNQGQYGEHLNATSALASSGSESLFINNADFAGTSFDERLVEYLRQNINPKGGQFFALHLLGSHFHYKRRYPEEFDVFKDNKDLPSDLNLSQEKMAVVNEYDNSIRYTDYVISKVIDSVENINVPVTVTYFSDHGEIVYDKGHDLYGHGGGKIPTHYELEVPFVIWVNKSYQKEFSERYKLAQTMSQQSFSLINFIAFYAKLTGLEVSIDLEQKENMDAIYYYDVSGMKQKHKDLP